MSTDIAKTDATNTLVTSTVLAFMQKRGFVSVHKEIRVNTKGYPYITFIDGGNVAENIYFSKSEAANVTEGQPIVKGFFDKLQIADTLNANNEVRTKIVGTSSNRLTLEDLF